MEFEFRADREAHLRMLCEEMGRSVDDFVNEAVLTFMEDYEDGRDAKLAIAEAEASGEPYLTLQQVMEKYEMELEDLAESGQADKQAGQNHPQVHPELPVRPTTRAA